MVAKTPVKNIPAFFIKKFYHKQLPTPPIFSFIYQQHLWLILYQDSKHNR
jgi:hypothetical protein